MPAWAADAMDVRAFARFKAIVARELPRVYPGARLDFAQLIATGAQPMPFALAPFTDATP